MWGSLSLGSIRDAAAKIKDGLEAQMDEAVQKSGPKVTRAGPFMEQDPSSSADGSLSPTRAAAAAITPSLLSPLSGVKGLQLPSRLGVGAGSSGLGNENGVGVVVGEDASDVGRGDGGYGNDYNYDPSGGTLGLQTSLQASPGFARRKLEWQAGAGAAGDGGEGGSAAFSGEKERPRVQRLPVSPLNAKTSADPCRNTPESAFLGNSVGDLGVDAGREGKGDGSQRSSVPVESTEAEVLPGAQEASLGGGARGGKSSVAGEGWGDIALDSDDDDDFTLNAAAAEDQVKKAEVLRSKEDGVEGSEATEAGMAVTERGGKGMVVPLQPPSVREDDSAGIEAASEVEGKAVAESSHPPPPGGAGGGSSEYLEQSSQPADGSAFFALHKEGGNGEGEGLPAERVSLERGDEQQQSVEEGLEEAGRKGGGNHPEEEVFDEGQIEDAENGLAPPASSSHHVVAGFSTEASVASGEGNGDVRKVEGKEEEEEGALTSSKAEPDAANVDGRSPTKDGLAFAAAAALDGADRNPEQTRRSSASLSTEGDARRARVAGAAERRRVGSEPPLPAPGVNGGKRYGGDDKGGEGNDASPTVGGEASGEASTGADGKKEKGEDLAAALAVARESEDALTARLLMAEELLAERERQLESTNISMAEMMQGGGPAGGGRGAASASATAAAAAAEISRLEGALEAERKKVKVAADAVKGWERRAEEFEEKDKMLQAYIEEGQALAYKQSEMEKSVRKARGSLRGVTEERDALAKEKLALEASLAGLRDELRARDEERATQSQSLAAMGAVSQASSQKLTTTEKELEKTREALSAKKAALDKAWGEIKDLKRSVSELKADKDALNRSLEDGGKARQATESQLQEWQARESSLLLEQSQLQETLERVRREADRREEEANRRQEDVRRRWKDAVARAEALQAEAHESTAPLLRQIRALQEEMRLRQEAVRAAEAALTERACSAEHLCREADKRRRVAEAQAAAAEERVHHAEGEVETLTFKVERLTAANEDLKGECERHVQRVSELEGELSAAKDASKANSLAHKAMESKLRLQVNDAEERLQEAQRRADMDRRDAKDTATTLREQIEEMRRGPGRSYLGPGVRRDSASSFSVDDPFGDGMRSVAGGTGTPRGRGSNGTAGVVGSSGGAGVSGSASFAEIERLQSLARQKEGHVAVLHQRLEEVQAIRDALTEEVTSLGRRNTELEALAKAVPLLRDQALELQRKNSVLLDLLGEKTEELEATQSDMKEVQNMYRAQYDELLSRAFMGTGATAS